MGEDVHAGPVARAVATAPTVSPPQRWEAKGLVTVPVLGRPQPPFEFASRLSLPTGVSADVSRGRWGGPVDGPDTRPGPKEGPTTKEGTREPHGGPDESRTHGTENEVAPTASCRGPRSPVIRTLLSVVTPEAVRPDSEGPGSTSGPQEDPGPGVWRTVGQQWGTVEEGV